MEAWSGLGLVRNYNDSHLISATNFPDLFNRTLAEMNANVRDFLLHYFFPTFLLGVFYLFVSSFDCISMFSYWFFCSPTRFSYL